MPILVAVMREPSEGHHLTWIERVDGDMFSAEYNYVLKHYFSS